MTAWTKNKMFYNLILRKSTHPYDLLIYFRSWECYARIRFEFSYFIYLIMELVWLFLFSYILLVNQKVSEDVATSKFSQYGLWRRWIFLNKWNKGAVHQLVYYYSFNILFITIAERDDDDDYYFGQSVEEKAAMSPSTGIFMDNFSICFILDCQCSLHMCKYALNFRVIYVPTLEGHLY